MTHAESDLNGQAGLAAGAVDAAAAAAELRAKFGVMTQDEAKENAFARILLLGPAKAGKTTAIAGTAPKPLVLNCDGLSATKGAKRVHAASRFDVIDVNSRASLIHGVKAAEAMVAAGHTRTVILDTATLLVDNILDEVTKAGFEGWDRWDELEKAVMGSVKRLAALEAHLFVISHMDPTKDPAQGILPTIGGKLKTRLPAMLDDWILLDVDPERDPERVFLLGPQKTWTHSGRNIRRKCMVEADVEALFEELGITP
jgi:hypothetical protein